MSALPDWCEPLLDAQQMRAMDRWAIEQRGIAPLELMERAGEGLAQALGSLAHDGLVTVVCGKGNNGGDGLVLARLLRMEGRDVTVVCLAPADELSHDARVNLDRLPGEPPLGIEQPAAGVAIEQASAIVDALLGTGFEGVPRPPVAEAIEAINRAPCPVLSVDVPSGVDASDGRVAGVAVDAAVTVTFQRAKPGLWIHPGKAHAGETVTIDIGIPRGAPISTAIGLIGADVLDALPRR